MPFVMLQQLQHEKCRARTGDKEEEQKELNCRVKLWVVVVAKIVVEVMVGMVVAKEKMPVAWIRSVSLPAVRP